MSQATAFLYICFTYQILSTSRLGSQMRVARATSFGAFIFKTDFKSLHYFRNLSSSWKLDHVDRSKNLVVNTRRPFLKLPFFVSRFVSATSCVQIHLSSLFLGSVLCVVDLSGPYGRWWVTFDAHGLLCSLFRQLRMVYQSTDDTAAEMRVSYSKHDATCCFQLLATVSVCSSFCVTMYSPSRQVFVHWLINYERRLTFCHEPVLTVSLSTF